jgi:hypothetical protein
VNKREQPEICQISYSNKADYQNVMSQEAFTSSLPHGCRLIPVNNEIYSHVFLIFRIATAWPRIGKGDPGGAIALVSSVTNYKTTALGLRFR